MSGNIKTFLKGSDFGPPCSYPPTLRWRFRRYMTCAFLVYSPCFIKFDPLTQVLPLAPRECANIAKSAVPHPQPAHNRTGIPSSRGSKKRAVRYGGGPHSHAPRRRQLNQPVLRQRQPTQKRGRCQSNGPDQTMRYISLRKRFLISSTLASRGLPGAHASA